MDGSSVSVLVFLPHSLYGTGMLDPLPLLLHTHLHRHTLPQVSYISIHSAASDSSSNPDVSLAPSFPLLYAQMLLSFISSATTNPFPFVLSLCAPMSTNNQAAEIAGSFEQDK